jgi:hypothetical protein
VGWAGVLTSGPIWFGFLTRVSLPSWFGSLTRVSFPSNRGASGKLLREAAKFVQPPCPGFYACAR